jgi:peptidoglycan/LPS O-acetylase OafA/YrhL
MKFLMFIQNWHRDSFGAINGVSWSVALEMQFYLLITLTVPLWWRCRHRPLLLWLGIWILALATKQWTWLQAEEYHWEVFQRFTRFVRLPAVLEEFACGMVVALLMRQRSALNKPLIVALFGLLLGLACILTPIYFANGSYWNVQGMILWWRTGLGIFFGLVVALAALCPAPSAPGWLYRSLYYLGEISYGIYLWHLLAITLLMQFFALAGVPLLLTTLCLTLLLASLSWHGLEKPLIAYSKRHRP